MGGRRRAGPACAAYVAITTALVLGAGSSDEVPLEAVSVVLGLVGPPLAAGLAVGRWPVVALAIVPAVAGIAAAFVVADPLTAIWAGFGQAVAGALALPLGVLASRRWRDERGRSIVVAVGLLCGVLVVPVALVQRERTVRGPGDRPHLVDVRAGTYRGVGVGDSVREVRRALGAGRRVRADEPIPRPGGPSYLDAGGEELRYPGAHFLLDRRGRVVRYVVVLDEDAATEEGLGLGDSISLFDDTYPPLACDEGSEGSDFPTDFPQCHGLVAPGRALYVRASYGRVGRPVESLLLSRRPVG